MSKNERWSRREFLGMAAAAVACFLSIGGGDDVVPFHTEAELEDVDDVDFIVNHEDTLAVLHTRNSIRAGTDFAK